MDFLIYPRHYFFAEQGLGGFKYITEESVEKDNNVVYHYQWDRDFGFAGSNYAYDEAITRLPNYINMPYSWKLTSYKYSTSMQTLENGHFNFEQFNYQAIIMIGVIHLVD